MIPWQRCTTQVLCTWCLKKCQPQHSSDDISRHSYNFCQEHTCKNLKKIICIYFVYQVIADIGQCLWL